MIKTEEIKQRADYTFKYNKKLGRHGWLRLTPAYSVKLVNELASTFNTSENILEPFSGTATTSLVLAENGISSVSFDINPFLVWFGSVKTKTYTQKEIDFASKSLKSIILEAEPLVNRTEYWLPELHNIERWWDAHTLKVLSALHHVIEQRFGCPPKRGKGDLIWVAFCRLIIETSSAAFNHVSMSFKDNVSRFEYEEITNLLNEIFNNILESAKLPLEAKPEIILKDSRTNNYKTSVKFNGVITSPPYPNRISYIRELRPYMYWTKFINISKEAGELDWNAIGGTWGIATSRLNEWEPNNSPFSDSLEESIKKISKADNKHAKVMAKYVQKYFHDIFDHFKTIKPILASNAKLHYIIGNSTFYGVEVASDIIYMDILRKLGFKNIGSEIVRKRNSKKGLFEYLITAEKE